MNRREKHRGREGRGVAERETHPGGRSECRQTNSRRVCGVITSNKNSMGASLVSVPSSRTVAVQASLV